MAQTIGHGISLPSEGHFPSLGGANAWLNSPPLTADGLRGKVVVVNFCTYTCINWLRSLPYVRPSAEAYRDHGLVVIGVHTPEFSFEHDLENVRQALRETRVEYPIAIDNDYAVWEAFANHYWPALYFIDAEGRIRHHRFGEGDYERSESVIQQLLAEAGLDDDGQEFVSVDARGPEAAADWNSLLSPETYLGYARTMDFASPGGLTPDEPRVYEAPRKLRRNHWSLSGDWTAGAEAVALNEAGGRIAFDVHARDVHLVMGPPTREAPVPFRVSLDGEPPGAAHGSDVDADGSGVLSYPRMYQVIRQEGPIGDRRFEIEFLDRGAQAFAFTFG
jgi:thiol-disulfide isomerase/thioredoxin